MSVVVSNEEIGPCRRRLKIEVPAPAVEAETRRVIADYRKKLQLPGFRRGKVPTQVIQKRFKDELDQEVLERLLPRYWRQAEAEADLEALLPPEVSDVEREDGADLTFVATVEVRPELTLGPLGDFQLPEMDTEPTDEEVAEALEELQRQRSTWRPVDRPAARGDRVSGDITELDEEGEPLGPARESRFEVGDPRVWDELTLAATGLAPGQKTELTRREEGAEGGEGEKVERRLRLELARVEERELPPLDDELADAFDYESLEKLTEDVTAQLRRDKKNQNRQRREEELMRQLRDRHPLQLPERVVEEEVRQLLNDYATELVRRGVDVEHAGVDWESLSEQVKPQAERRVHNRLLLDEIAEEEIIVVDEGELEATLAALARAEGQSAALVRRRLDEAGKLEMLRAQLRRARTVKHLLGELEEPEEASSEPAESAD